MTSGLQGMCFATVPLLKPTVNFITDKCGSVDATISTKSLQVGSQVEVGHVVTVRTLPVVPGV